MDKLPAIRNQPPDRLRAENSKKAIAVSAWTGKRSIVIGDETKEEWITFDGEVPQVLKNK